MRLLTWPLLALVAVAGCSAEPRDPPPPGFVADWPAYGATPGGTHFSRADQITPDNVAQLQVAWLHRSGDVREAEFSDERKVTQSSLQVTPIVVGERLYYCSPFNKVFALNAETGDELWSYDPGVVRDEVPVLPNCRGVSSWQSGQEGFCEQRIFVGTVDARLIALDAQTGKPCTDFGKTGEIDVSDRISEHDPMEYGITSPPAILGDRVISGGMVLDNQRTDAPSGIVRAWDVRSGKLLWGWNPVPPGMPERNPDGSYLSGTTNVWSIISVDPDRDLVFLPTGNTNPDYFGGHRQGLDYYSSSVVALHGASGEVAWHYQMVHHDVWDYDTPAQPTLVDLEVNGEIVPAVIQVTKMGLTFALHRDTGKPLWPVEERPVPSVSSIPEEQGLSPTQPFPSHIPQLLKPPLTGDDAWGMLLWDRLRCADLIDSLDNQGWYTPPSTRGSVHFPVSAGGNNWGSPAIDPDSRVMVVYTTRVPGYIKLVPREDCEGSFQPQAGTPYCVETGFLMSPLGVPCTAPPWGTLDAIDLEAGKLLWSTPMGSSRDIAPFPLWWLQGIPGIGGPMITSSGLVFSGVSNEHAFRAFSLETGAELWKVRLPTAANAVPMTYQLRPDGRQFVVVAAGGHWSGGSPPGDYLIAYALPEKP
jgi:quinoprotein glucose dehydrogenase